MDQRHCTWVLNQELDAAIDAHKQAVKDLKWASTAGKDWHTPCPEGWTEP